jgi:hypothetical protein
MSIRPTYPQGYYVYAYLRKTDRTPYYIGKGQKGRLYSKNHRVAVPEDLDNIEVLVQELDRYQANDMEIRLIRWYGRKDLGTGILQNRTNGGEGLLGPSEETKAKIGAASSKANKGKKRGPHSQETKERIRDAKLGQTHSEETKMILSLKNKGRTTSLKGRPSPLKGRPHSNKGSKRGPMSEERKAKISAAHKARTEPAKRQPHSEETKAKLRAALLGKPHTEERKANLRAGHQRRKEKLLGLVDITT